MQVSYMPPIDHHGLMSKKRMHLRPVPPMPINYASAAIPTYAPFGTEYTPGHTMKIIGSRRISYPESMVSNYPAYASTPSSDPAISPTKSIQHVHALDGAHWAQQSKPRFDTTYRTEFINRIRHPEYTPWYQQKPPDQFARPIRPGNSSLNQYSVLPPISAKTTTTIVPNRTEASARSNKSEVHSQPAKNEDAPRYEPVPQLNFQNGPPMRNDYQQPRMAEEDPYLPKEPVLLTDYEEQRLSEQIREQLSYANIIDRLKLFYQELTAYDRNRTNYVHYSTIQMLGRQLGLNLQEDTLRFAMCKFVSPDRMRGFVNYEDLIRYLGRCLSAVQPNPYGEQRSESPRKNGYQHRPVGSAYGSSVVNEDEQETFDPDERQTRALLKQNLKFFDLNGSIDFDKLTRELNNADRSQSGVLNRQQIEEVVYKVRIPLQRSLIFQILEKHCKAYLRLYRWQAFVQYLQEQVLDLKQVQDRSSPVYTQHKRTRNQWLDEIRREHSETDRLRVIERFIANHDGQRVENNHPSAWFTRFLSLANAMYSHRTSSNKEQDFVLPREEARRLLRAYNQVWDLKIGEERLLRVLDACARNGNTAVDDALKFLAK